MADEHTYQGFRTGPLQLDCVVKADGRRLPMPRGLIGGFEWGYQGHGPTLTAAAVLDHEYADRQLAMALAPDFARVVVSRLPHAAWSLAGRDVRAAVEQIRKERRKLARAKGVA